MTRRTRTTAIALTGAVALASAAYGLGTQREDGSATAARTASGSAPFRLGLDRLADRLGVSSDKLRAALDDVRKDRAAPDDRLAGLAKALGVSTDRLEAAFEKLRDEHRPCDGDRGDLAAALAAELGLSESKVRSALDEQRQQMEAD